MYSVRFGKISIAIHFASRVIYSGSPFAGSTNSQHPPSTDNWDLILISTLNELLHYIFLISYQLVGGQVSF